MPLGEYTIWNNIFSKEITLEEFIIDAGAGAGASA